MTSAISAGLQAGFLSPVVGHEYQLSQASDAHRDIMEGKGAKGKLVLLTETVYVAKELFAFF